MLEVSKQDAESHCDIGAAGALLHQLGRDYCHHDEKNEEDRARELFALT